MRAMPCPFCACEPHVRYFVRRGFVSAVVACRAMSCEVRPAVTRRELNGSIAIQLDRAKAAWNIRRVKL